MPTETTAAADALTALDYFLEICPEADERRRRLHASAIELGELTATEFYTMRDWLSATGCHDRPGLDAVLILLFLALREGSLCLELDEAKLGRRLEELVGGADAAWWAREIVRTLAAGCPGLIGADAVAGTPLVRQTIQGRDYLFFQKHLRHERTLLAEIQKRLTPGLTLAGGATAQQIAGVVRAAAPGQPSNSDGKTWRLDPDQEAALALALARPLAIISGGPGTGKTSIVLTLLRCLIRCGIAAERFALAAPTGRAAQRLGDALRGGLSALGEHAAAEDLQLAAVTPTTLHRLLGYRPDSGAFRRHEENPIPADVIIVDEISMVSLPLLAVLLRAALPSARLVLLGDKDQLPSVEAGAVLAHLVPEGFEPHLTPAFRQFAASVFAAAPGRGRTNAKPHTPEQPGLFDHHPLDDTVALLRVNHRSEQRIQEAARAIGSQETAVVERLPRHAVAGLTNAAGWLELAREGGCQLVPMPAAHVNELRKLLHGWARHAYLEASTPLGTFPELAARCRLNTEDDYDAATRAGLTELLALIDRARLLTLVREGPWGCVGVNQAMELLLRPHVPRGGRPGLFAGAPLLISHTDHELGLYNGDVGLALQAEGDGIRVVFQRPEGLRSYVAESLPAHEPAFAMTVHKSQGSEYEQVLLLFPPEGARRLLTRELVYTGVTRARSLAVLAGKEEVIRHAIASRVEREAGLLRTLHEA